MKLTRILGLAAAAALAVMIVASPASATTLETNGVKQTSAITLEATLKAGTSSVLSDTSGGFANTCTQASAEGKDSTSVTGTVVSGPISTLTFSNCIHEPVVVNSKGSLSVEWIKETSGTVRSSGTSITVAIGLFGGTTNVTCTTNNTDLGTLTGVSSGSATLALNAVINCGFLLPSAKWQATYLFTGPAGLGITS